MKKPVIQTHHIARSPEITVRIFQGEHWLATQMDRRKNISKGFITYLKFYIALKENNAKEV